MVPNRTLAATLRSLTPGAAVLRVEHGARGGGCASATVLVLEHPESGVRIERTTDDRGRIDTGPLEPGHWLVHAWDRSLLCAPGGFRIESDTTSDIRIVVYARERSTSTSMTSR